MPEISFCLFDLKQLFKLFPKVDREFESKIDEYERKTQEDMAQIRLNLYSDFGYESEFDKACI